MKVPSWTPCGVVHLDIDDEDAVHTKKLIEKQLYPEEFAQALNTDIGIEITQSALLQSTAGYVSPPDFCAALLKHPNIETRYAETVEDLDLSGIVVIAFGNGSKHFPATAWMPLQSLRGQISIVTATEKSSRLKTVVCHKGFMTPAINGVHIVGATFQKESPAVPEIRDADHAENLDTLKEYLPSLDIATVTGGRTGYRATTPDKLPMIGPCPRLRRVRAEGKCRHRKSLRDDGLRRARPVRRGAGGGNHRGHDCGRSAARAEKPRGQFKSGAVYPAGFEAEEDLRRRPRRLVHPHLPLDRDDVENMQRVELDLKPAARVDGDFQD